MPRDSDAIYFVKHCVRHKKLTMLKHTLTSLQADSKDVRGLPLLFYALAKDDDDDFVVVKCFEKVYGKLKIDVRDCFGNTALLYTLKKLPHFYLRKIAYLLEQGADINAKNDKGETALLYALRKQMNPAVIAYLLAKGACVNVCDNLNNSALLYALMYPQDGMWRSVAGDGLRRSHSWRDLMKMLLAKVILNGEPDVMHKDKPKSVTFLGAAAIVGDIPLFKKTLKLASQQRVAPERVKNEVRASLEGAWETPCKEKVLACLSSYRCCSSPARLLVALRARRSAVMDEVRLCVQQSTLSEVEFEAVAAKASR